MARVFALDVLECPRCGGRMRILAAIEDPSVARKILDSLGCPRGLLLWLSLPVTHNPNSPNSDGQPTAVADVCFHAERFSPVRRIPAFKSMCVPEKFLQDAPKSGLCDAVTVLPRMALRKSVFVFPRL
jgi:hypothetical protein